MSACALGIYFGGNETFPVFDFHCRLHISHSDNDNKLGP